MSIGNGMDDVACQHTLFKNGCFCKYSGCVAACTYIRRIALPPPCCSGCDLGLLGCGADWALGNL